MKLGVATVITDEGIRPDVLAKALEERGFDSLVVAEHSHTPASRATPFPAGGELPREYYRSYDPFVALTAAALATSELLIGPGVLLLPQRDSIQTAKEVSSLDQISGGRVLLGLGLGWNLEEATDHGVHATLRGKLLDEKLAAMKELWANDEAEFHGRYVDFDATYCWPKPVQKPHPKIYFGGFTRATVSRARRHHGGWMPMAVPAANMVPAQLSLLDGATDIPVSVIVPESAEPAVLDAYRQHGAERAFIQLSARPESETLQVLDRIAALSETQQSRCKLADAFWRSQFPCQPLQPGADREVTS
jgi:probable F420-dependent oxidoreductase